jgi:HK97 family phage major capsid protein
MGCTSHAEGTAGGIGIHRRTFYEVTTMRLSDRYYALKKEKEALLNEARELLFKAEGAHRDLTGDESKRFNAIDENVKRVNRGIEMEMAELDLPPARFGTGPSTFGGGGRVSIGDGGPYALRGPSDPKGYADLFGPGEHKWQDKSTGFFDAVLSGRHHPDLAPKGMDEKSGSGGGFLVPTEQSEKIHAVALENEIIMPRCFVQPMKSNELKLPAMKIGSHTASLFGGFVASYVGEAANIPENDPTTRSMTLVAKKLTGRIRFSNELMSDIPGGENQIIQICGKGLGWYRDKAFLSGSGVGSPLGILNSGALISVTPETGQLAKTITYENLAQMFSRMHPASLANAVWIANSTAIPQLLSLTIGTGTGGVYFPVLKETSGVFSIFGKECIFTEKVPALGTKGDILLCDLSQYVAGLRQGMRFDLSSHVYFTTDETSARLIERHDGQPLWNEPLTLEDGVSTVSPFVALAAR